MGVRPIYLEQWQATETVDGKPCLQSSTPRALANIYLKGPKLLVNVFQKTCIGERQPTVLSDKLVVFQNGGRYIGSMVESSWVKWDDEF